VATIALTFTALYCRGPFAAFFAATFFEVAGSAFAVAAFLSAQRFLRAATIAFLPAVLSFRFGLGAFVTDGDPDWPLDSAHRFRCASAMRFRAAALIFRRLPIGTAGAALGSVGPPSSIRRTSAI